MAKYEVKMSCGHVETVQLFGKMDDRYKKIEWLEKNGVCTECQKAQKAQEHAEATAKAAEKASAENLPELTGSEKQINWALTIRAEKLAQVDTMLEKISAACNGDEEKIALAKIQSQAIKNVLVSYTDSKFWIDNRDYPLKEIIKVNNLAETIKAELESIKNVAENNTDTTSAEEIKTTSVAENFETTLSNCKKEFGAVGNAPFCANVNVDDVAPVEQVYFNTLADAIKFSRSLNKATNKKIEVDNGVSCFDALVYGTGKYYYTINPEGEFLGVYTPETVDTIAEIDGRTAKNVMADVMYVSGEGLAEFGEYYYLKYINLSSLSVGERQKLEESRQNCLANATVYPANEVTKEPVIFRYNPYLKQLEAKTPKNDTVRQILKDNAWSWDIQNSVWTYRINSYRLPYRFERVAECGNKLLNAGVPITIANDKIRTKAVDADYIPANPHYILEGYNGDTTTIRICWDDEFNKTLYKIHKNIKSLPGAKYSGGVVHVPTKYYNEIWDFAKTYNFGISDEATKLLEIAKNNYDSRTVVTVAESKKNASATENILDSSRAIIDDLRDDD